MLRLAMPDQIAPAILFLASNSVSTITGHTLAVDGDRVERPGYADTIDSAYTCVV